MRIRRATALARSRSPESTEPERPYADSLAIRTASSSPSCGITTSTGPKISSWASREVLSRPATTVGSIQKPSCSMTWPPVAKVPPSSSASRRYAATRSRWTSEITGPQIAPGSAGSLAPIDSMVVGGDLDGLVVAVPRHHQPGGDRAPLAGVDAGGEGGGAGHRGHVGVVERDGRGLAAELEEDPLQGGRGGGHDRPAGRGRAGERHHVDPRVGGQHRGDLVGPRA